VRDSLNFVSWKLRKAVAADLRKFTKSIGSFRNDDALIKLSYLALRNISKKWTMPIQNWKATLNRFTIMFDERMAQH
jgi:putative transposase